MEAAKGSRRSQWVICWPLAQDVSTVRSASHPPCSSPGAISHATAGRSADNDNECYCDSPPVKRITSDIWTPPASGEALKGQVQTIGSAPEMRRGGSVPHGIKPSISSERHGIRGLLPALGWLKIVFYGGLCSLFPWCFFPHLHESWFFLVPLFFRTSRLCWPPDAELIQSGTTLHLRRGSQTRPGGIKFMLLSLF